MVYFDTFKFFIVKWDFIILSFDDDYFLEFVEEIFPQLQTLNI